MSAIKEELKKIPAVNTLLASSEIKALVSKYNHSLIKYCIRDVININRQKALSGKKLGDFQYFINHIIQRINALTNKNFKKVYNATGVIINTNLGRSPFEKKILAESFSVLEGYNNLEFDLNQGKRGSRHSHTTDILKYLCESEDCMVVNNNAAALYLILKTFSNHKEVIVSRGELIEIGGSFRLPDIMATSDCKMKEVGTTNKTHLRDYENAIAQNTALFLKAHTSNYVIKGFTQEVELTELVTLGKKHKIPVVYDMGSGLLHKLPNKALKNEPVVKDILKTGVDLLCFSGDKLLGGPQAGIIVGKSSMIKKLKTHPLARVLRIGKTTIALLEATLINSLTEENQVFAKLNISKAELKKKALKLKSILEKDGILTDIVESKGRCGGGSTPDVYINSFAVLIKKPAVLKMKKDSFSKKIYYLLLHADTPIVGILKQGQFYIDFLTLPEKDINILASIITNTLKAEY